MSRLATLLEQVAKYRCERCWKLLPIEELVEQDSDTNDNLVVCKECVDNVGFNEGKRNSTRDAIDHHFTT